MLVYRFRELRRRLDITQRTVSRRANVDPTYYNSLEKGLKGSALPLNTALRLAKALECDVHDLYYHADEAETTQPRQEV